MTLVILAAGMGSRYGGLKQLDPMTDKGEVLLDFSIYDAIRAGFDRVVFIIKEENLSLFRESVGARLEGQVEVRYAFQSSARAIPEGAAVPPARLAPGAKPLGTGQALLCAQEAIGDDLFAVLNADDFYGRDAFERIARFLRSADPAGSEFAMAGYILEKTLTEHGSVSRGICEVDGEGYLQKIAERTKIYRGQGGEVVFEEGGAATPTDPAGVVSMNFWALTPAVFPLLQRGLSTFLADLSAGRNPAGLAKAEFYLPVLIGDAIAAGDCRVKVLPTSATWFGVTYPEDKPKVKENLAALTAAGEYPDGLWG